MLAHPEQFVHLWAYQRLYGIGPERDDLRAQAMTAQSLNHARIIADKSLPAEVSPKDLYYLKVQAPPPETLDETAERFKRQLPRA